MSCTGTMRTCSDFSIPRCRSGAPYQSSPEPRFILCIVLCLTATFPNVARPADETKDIEKRLFDSVSFLASEECGGRAPGTEGIDLAAEYIAQQFRDAGLRTDLLPEGAFQKFVFENIGQVGPCTDEFDPRRTVKNVVGVLDGAGAHADEAIVIGAHYDHLGRQKSRAGKVETYNGADDNASGVAVMIEMARSLAGRETKSSRQLVFVAFTAEERGLVGSRYYVEHPPVPLEKTVAMINLDSVGRLRHDRLIVLGTGTSGGFDDLINRLCKRHALRPRKLPGVSGGSDHKSFLSKNIPVLCFVTGSHADFHEPTDDVEKLNIKGMRRVCQLASDVVVDLAEWEERPKYTTEGFVTRARQVAIEVILTNYDKIADLIRQHQTR